MHPSKDSRREAWVEKIRASRTHSTPDERFWAKVRKTERCWLFDGAKCDGYGLFRPDGRRGKVVRAHRWSLEKKLGRAIRPGFKALHECDVRNCVRSDHLYEGTSLDNAKDRDRRGRFVDHWSTNA